MAHMLPYFCSVRVTSLDCLADLPTRLLPRLHQSFHPWLMLSTRVPTVLSHCGTGISTCCPSATPPTYPEQISFTLETLDIRPEGFPPSSRYSFRHSLFDTVHSSLSVLLLPVSNAPLPISYADSQASAVCFSPGHFRRRTSRLVSYYALFECMAASEPTS